MRPFLKNIWLAQFTSSAHSVRSSFLAGLLMLTKHKNRTAKNAAPRSLPTGDLSRAGFLRLAVSMGAAPLVGHKLAAAQTRDEGKAMQKRPIPLSGEALPVIGCGTYVGFDVGADPEKLKALADVVRTLRDAGGKVFDSSPHVWSRRGHDRRPAGGRAGPRAHPHRHQGLGARASGRHHADGAFLCTAMSVPIPLRVLVPVALSHCHIAMRRMRHPEKTTGALRTRGSA
jgi:hypothetical protein